MRLSRSATLAAMVAALPLCTALPYDLSFDEPADALCAKPAAKASCRLTRSVEGMLLRLVRAEMGEERIVARSYDGHPWEGLNPVPMVVACPASGDCSFEYDPTMYHYTVKRVVVMEPTGKKHHTAKLLSQGTFGARKSDIEGFDPRGGGDGNAAGKWLDLQMSHAPFLMRPYLRLRSNPRPAWGVHGDDVYEPCHNYARWHEYAFSKDDAGLVRNRFMMRPAGPAQVEARDAGAVGMLRLLLDGEPLTEIPASNFPGQQGKKYSVCTVDELARVGGEVQLSEREDCGGARLVMTNPPISFEDDSALTLSRADDDPTAQFLSLSSKGVENVLISDSVNEPACSAAYAARSGGRRWNETVYFLKQESKLYRYDARVRLYANTVAKPLEKDTAWSGVCPSAEVNWINAETCSSVSLCGKNGRACGSRGEGANDPREGNAYSMYPLRKPIDRNYYTDNVDYEQWNDDQKTQLFHNIAVKEESHQLRYRVAWALMQILPTSIEGIGRAEVAEQWANYMDIFTTHAFGNYMDIIKEVSYSPVMGEYLTYLNNRGYATAQTLPDQNYAREVMQLFMIGLYEMNMDGSAKLDASGKKITTYGTHDIVTFARVWTGFVLSPLRGNVENRNPNFLDPMVLEGENRDTFPKADLRGGYIGDAAPLCSDLPPQHFLHKGSVYVLAGDESVEGEEFDVISDEAAEQLLPPGVDIEMIQDGLKCRTISSCADPDADRLGFYELFFAGEVTDVKRIRVPNMHIHGDNGNSTPIFEVVSIGEHPKGKRIQFAPFGVHTSMTGYRDFERDFGDRFPVGTKLTVTNSPDPILPGAAVTVLKHYAPAPNHPLFRALCDGQAGQCSRKPQVVLDSDLTCDGDAACEDLEDMKTVKLQSGSETLFYHHVRERCVQMAVYAGQATAWKLSSNSRVEWQCADPRVPVAGAVCCDVDRQGDAVQPTFNYKPPQCRVLGELMSHAEADTRCRGDGKVLCTDVRKDVAMTRYEGCASKIPQWLDAPCAMSIQVRSDGAVSLVLPNPYNEIDARFMNGTANKNTFYPVWHGDAYPTVEGSRCDAADAGSLLCAADIREEVLFAAPPSLRDARQRLVVGAVDPARYGGLYELACAAGASCDKSDPAVDVLVYHHTEGASRGFDRRTIIGVRVPGRFGGGFQYFMNRVEWVQVDGFIFRNAPRFMPASGEKADKSWPALGRLAVAEKHAAAHETDAVITHLVRHDNTAPFVAQLLIQRLVTSNPSPRYIEVVATAFSTGRYKTRGSGRHGCMKATMAALLLDREARSMTLDADPGHGVAREPLLKILHVLRAMEVSADNGAELRTFSYYSKIGQDIFNAPSVFGFYLPTNEPSGPLAERGLVSPEAELFTPPSLFSLLDRLVTLSSAGLCTGSLGAAVDCHETPTGVAHYDPLPGETGFPTRDINERIIDELDLVLTDGRLSPDSRDVILEKMAVFTPPFAGDPAAAAEARAKNVAVARELIMILPEFHVTNLRMPVKNETRSAATLPGRKGNAGYKAVVVIEMRGGCDTHSYLVPGEQCGANGEKVSYDQYRERRGMVAKERTDLLKITPKNGHAQPCEDFYVNKNLSYVHKAFEEGDAAWFANIGSLVQPVTRHDKRSKAKQFPPFLASHNFQQKFAATMHPQEVDAWGLMGRMAAAFKSVGNTNVYSLDHYRKIASEKTYPATVLSRRSGAVQLKAHERYAEAIDQLLAMPSGSFHAETYQEVVQRSVGVSKELARMLDDLRQNGNAFVDEWPENSIGEQLNVVSQIMRLRDSEGMHIADRDLFACNSGAFDTHFVDYPGRNTPPMDAAIGNFSEEMKKQGMWQDVVVVTTSEFGRTITSNGQGTDHGWGGNYFAVGGSIKDQVMLSTYVESLGDDEHDLNWGNGIIIPKWGFEVIWAPVIDWFGVPKDAWYTVLPNLPNFGPICKFDLFEFDQSALPPGTDTTCVMPEPPAGMATSESAEATPPPVELQPLGNNSFTEVCPYRAVADTPLHELGYVLGRVDSRAAIEFRLKIAPETWAAVGLRDVSSPQRGMEGIDITASDTADAVVRDYDVTLFAFAPDPQPVTQTQLSAHREVNGMYEIAFYRLLDNGYDFPVALGGEVNLAVATGAGTITGAWAMHSATEVLAVQFKGCEKDLVPPELTTTVEATTTEVIATPEATTTVEATTTEVIATPEATTTEKVTTTAEATGPTTAMSPSPGGATASVTPVRTVPTGGADVSVSTNATDTLLVQAVSSGGGGSDGFPGWLIAVIVVAIMLFVAAVVVAGGLYRRKRASAVVTFEEAHASDIEIYEPLEVVAPGTTPCSHGMASLPLPQAPQPQSPDAAHLSTPATKTVNL